MSGAGWDSLRAGILLPPQTHACTRIDAIKYAAASGDFNPVHYDLDSPERRAHGALLLPGRFKQACLGRLVADWLAHRGILRRLSCRYVQADPVGSPITCKGEVRRRLEEGERRSVELRLWIENAAGERTTVGSAAIDWRVD